MKKLLNISALTLATTPIISVVACGTDDKTTVDPIVQLSKETFGVIYKELNTTTTPASNKLVVQKLSNESTKTSQEIVTENLDNVVSTYIDKVKTLIDSKLPKVANIFMNESKKFAKLLFGVDSSNPEAEVPKEEDTLYYFLKTTVLDAAADKKLGADNVKRFNDTIKKIKDIITTPLTTFYDELVDDIAIITENYVLSPLYSISNPNFSEAKIKSGSDLEQFKSFLNFASSFKFFDEIFNSQVKEISDSIKELNFEEKSSGLNSLNVVEFIKEEIGKNHTEILPKLEADDFSKVDKTYTLIGTMNEKLTMSDEGTLEIKFSDATKEKIAKGMSAMEGLIKSTMPETPEEPTPEQPETPEVE